LIIVLAAFVAAGGCGKNSDKYCGLHPEDPACDLPPMIDARAPIIDTPPACTNNTKCTSATEPVCDLSGGAGVCVHCTAMDHTLCSGITPICTDHACQACQDASDCPLSGLCLASGACADEGDVAYVEAGAPDNTSCTKLMPCPKIAIALATQTTAQTPRPYLKIKGAFDEAVAISRNVAVFADTGASLTRSTGGPVMTVSGTSIVEIDDLTITNSHGGSDPGIATSDTTALTLKRVTISKNKGNGIACSGTSLSVSESTFSENGAAGLSCAKGSLALSSSILTKNAGGGLIATGGSFDITNNFLYDNGDKDNAFVGAALLNPAASTTNRFEFNTVVDNHVRDFITTIAGGVTCDVPGFTAPNNIIARNDIHDNVDKPNANSVGACTYPTSAITTTVTGLMFMSPDADPRDYHLKAGSSAIDQATTGSTVTVDAQGDTRPQGPAKDQGADELKPGG
jgi:hypothetical protein